MKLVIGWLLFWVLSHERHGSAVVGASVTPNAEEEKIDAVLALAKSSLSCSGKEDKREILKNAMILLSEYKDSAHIDAGLAELMAETQSGIEKQEQEQCLSSSPENTFLNYADRHARRVAEIAHDFDCMEREFDTSDPKFDPKEAAEVFNKCRLLVLRNVFPKKEIAEYRQKYEDYILAVHTGEIDKSNTKTTDAKAGDIVQKRGRKRHDIVLPQWLGGEQIAGNPTVLKILRHEKALGRDMIPNQVGSVIAEAGAPAMYWHEDQEYIFDQDSFENSGIGGHDLPPYTANMFIPLLDATIDHGPTEFCVGSTHTEGIPKWPNIVNETLTEKGSPFHKMREFEFTGDACPPEHWRVPLVGMGDAVIFDYHLTHRGGANMSPELRALFYVTYSRFWFRDFNYDASEKKNDEISEFDAWATGMRYAMIDQSEVKHVPQAGATLASVENFAGIKKDTRTKGNVKFTFTNMNVEGASVYLEDKLLMKDIAPKTNMIVRARIGEELSAHDKYGKVIKTWTIVSEPRQTILLKNNV